VSSLPSFGQTTDQQRAEFVITVTRVNVVKYDRRETSAANTRT